MIDWIRKFAWSTAASPLFRRFLRFAMVGGASGAFYAASVAVMAGVFAVSAPIASAVAYALAIPVNFFANRRFTFRARGSIRREAIKFGLVHGLNMYVSYELMRLASENLESGLWIGIGLCIVAAPIVTFVLLSCLVFVERDPDESLAN